MDDDDDGEEEEEEVNGVHHQHEHSETDANHFEHGEPSDVSIQLDSIYRDRSSTIGSFRDRGLTFGSVSEFDLGLGFEDGHTGTVGPGHSDVGADGDDGNRQTVIEFAQDASNNVQKSMNVVSANRSSTASGMNGYRIMQPQSHNLQQQLPSQHNDGDGTSVEGDSSVHFFSGMFGTNGNDRSSSATGLLGHTPPSVVATSYEGKHFGKRMRAGSISGRLRSMSDLEDRGIIDRHQKGVLKDLIISGDDDLQAALDKWDQGDKSALESIVSRLKTRHSSDIDLLGDLDLDFLSMGNTDFGVVGDMGIGGGDNHIASKTMSIPIPGKSSSSMAMLGSNPGSGASTPRIRDPSPAPMMMSHGEVGVVGMASYDGIGELDFNGDYAGAVEQTPYQQAVYHQSVQGSYSHAHLQPQAISTGTKFRSDPLSEFQRNRANSLAFGILLDEPNPNDFQDSVGKWMDRHPSATGIPEESKPLKKRSSSHVVGANGGLYIVHNPAQDMLLQPPALDSMKLSKSEIAAMKRREREERKAQREAERLAKKEKKEEEARLRKANKANKQEKKAKKAEAKKKKEEIVSDEEPKVIVSGTGRPRSLSDPNLSIGLDDHGLMHIDHPPDWVGAYSPDSRKLRIERFLAKRNHRVWIKKVKYDVRKSFADSRLRVKGRFVKKEDELLMRDLMSLT
mmetsp:Transcript_16589/g.31427  ORF Transcript_16589/g.31427 Transcript_16589/m.31427 type:complete len:679 (-) Transcript_16589:1437-3473(-)